jgi:predicted transcriptional regulator
MKIRPYNKKGPHQYDLLNGALRLAIHSYMTNESILQALEEKYNEIKEILYILGKEKIRRYSKYKKGMDLLIENGLLKCNDNYCEVTDEGISLYEKYKSEKDTLEEYLEDFYIVGIHNIDMKPISDFGLDSILKYVEKYGLPESKRKYANPFVEMLLINQPKNYTMHILSTEYVLTLLLMYRLTLSCEFNGRCINYHVTGGRILRELEEIGIYREHFPPKPLLSQGLIEEESKSKRKRYRLSQLGYWVSRYLTLQAYITSHL